MNVIGYIRVSTEDQARSGLGLEAQQAAIISACRDRGWTVEDMCADEGVSGKTPWHLRPALSSALTQLEAGVAGALMVAKLDRLTRSVGDFANVIAEAEEHHWDFVALDLAVDTTTPSGRFLANIMASFAQFEAEMISTRTREGLAAKRARGERLGRAPNVPADILARIRRERDAGKTLAGIADDLMADGVPTAQNRGSGRWHPSTIRHLLLEEPR